jgi:hypothetical protein
MMVRRKILQVVQEFKLCHGRKVGRGGLPLVPTSSTGTDKALWQRELDLNIPKLTAASRISNDAAEK